MTDLNGACPTMTLDQIDALRAMMREHDADQVVLTEWPHHTIYAVAWTDDDETPAVVATISVGGTVRIEARVAA